MIVNHPTRHDWGPGKVIAVHGEKIHVIFRDFPGREAKVLTTKSVTLEKAEIQSDPILDNLPPLKEKKGKYLLPRKRITLKQAEEDFKKSFPQGFADPSYLGDRTTGERNYKLYAHKQWLDKLGNGKVRELLDSNDIEELAERALSIISKVNLLSSFEKMAIHDALIQQGPAKKFFNTLIDLLDSPDITSQVYEPYIGAVCNLPQEKGKARVATWPVATILPFLAQPDRHMFLKPDTTLPGAETLGFDLHYRSEPNWITYDALLRMGGIYKSQIEHLAPKDFIDVQSFIWVTCGGYDA